jgi:GC-rich sequence DNA-binding factor
MSTAVIPRLSNLIEGGAFDPFSSKDTRRVVNLAEEVEISVEKGNYKFQVIIGSS